MTKTEVHTVFIEFNFQVVEKIDIYILVMQYADPSSIKSFSAMNSTPQRWRLDDLLFKNNFPRDRPRDALVK